MTDATHNQTGTEPVGAPSARIYLDYYQLAEAPFAITPDPEFLFSSGCHRQVLDKIAYAIDSRMGFVLLTGEVGTGKTTLCRSLLDRLAGKAETVYVINPSISGQELLAGMLEDAGASPAPTASKKAIIDRLYQHLLADVKRRPFVAIVDDAQTMSAEALEDLRLLSNLETDKHKLIQVVLSGQPELLNLLDSDRLRQLKQRIAIQRFANEFDFIERYSANDGEIFCRVIFSLSYFIFSELHIQCPMKIIFYLPMLSHSSPKNLRPTFKTHYVIPPLY